MAIDFKKWNADFGGQAAVDAVNDAKKNEYTEVPEGTYICKLDKLELSESQKGYPMVKGQFRISEGAFKNQCLFYNGVMTNEGNKNQGFLTHNVLEFLRSLEIFGESDIDFDGNYEHFNDLLLDLAENSEGLKFEIDKGTQSAKNGNSYTRLEITDVFE